MGRVMGGILAIARLDARRRWRSLVTIVLLVALGAGAVMSLVAGARRGASAADRLDEATDAATVYINPPSTTYDAADWDRVRALPYVAGVAPTVVFCSLDVDDPRVPDCPTTYPPIDARYGTDVDRPVVLEGRMYDPAAVDEAVVTTAMAHTYGHGVGSTVRVRLGDASQATADPLPIGELLGPWVTLHVVGVVRSDTMLDSGDHPARIGVTPAFTRRYWSQIHGPSTGMGHEYADASIAALVRLRHGTADIPQLETDVARLFGAHANVIDRKGNDQLGRTAAGFQSRVLLAMAIAALLAAVVLIGQAVRRHIADGEDDLRLLGSLGAERRTAAAGAGLPIALASALGALGAMGVAVLASRWFPIGSAARVEPHPGMRFDVLVLPAGAALTAALCMTSALVIAYAATAAARPARPGTAIARLAARLPLSVGLGARFALEPGRGRRRAPIGTTLLACICGVAGVAAALVFGSGLQAAIGDPAQLGQTYSAFTLTGMQGQDFIPPRVVHRALSDLSAVSAVEESRAGQAHTADGRDELWLKDFTGFSPVVLSGRLPMAADEISLTPATAADLHTAVGRQVTLRGDAGPLTFEVVGESYLYTGFLERYDFGGWVAPAGYERLFQTLGMRYWYLVGRDGATQADIRAEMLAKHPDWLAEGLSVMPPDIAQAQRNMTDVRGLPIFLGAFLALLAIAAAAHALALSIRRRRHDLGIARTLGMTPSQGASALVVQSLVSTAVGVVVGLPLGLAAGRTAWRWMSAQIPVQFLPPGPWAELGLISLAALCVGLLIAALPAVRAARLPIADALRAE